MQVLLLLQYQSKGYYIIGQEAYYSIGRFITLSGSYYIIGRFYDIIGQLLQYRAFITLSVGTRRLVICCLDFQMQQIRPIGVNTSEQKAAGKRAGPRDRVFKR